MRNTSLLAFNPHNTGLFEAQLWRAYYDRDWLLSLQLLFRLMRSQFGLSPWQALRAALWGTVAGLAWKPVTHNTEIVRRLLLRFYIGVRNATKAEFDPGEASAAELHYWAVHRELSGQVGRPELVDALARITAALYGLSLQQAVPAAIWRARACDLVDDITGGRQTPTPEAWNEIFVSLREGYALLHAELQSSTT